MLPRSLVYVIFFIYGAVLPCYWSHKALKHKNDQDIKKWLTHWIIFTSFVNFLSVTNFLFGCWLPFYNEIVLFVFIWLTSPSLRGSGFLYSTYFSPTLSIYEKTIEDKASKATSELLNFALKLSTSVTKYAAKITLQILKESNITFLNEISFVKNLEFSTDLHETKENAVTNLEANVEEKNQNSRTENFDERIVYEDKAGNMVCDINKLFSYLEH